MHTEDITLVALASLLIGAAIRALKSDAFDDVLRKLGLPSLPKRALPWVSVGLGLAGGLVTGFSQTGTAKGALAFILQGFLAGSGAVLGHELGIESLRDGKEII